MCGKRKRFDENLMLSKMVFFKKDKLENTAELKAPMHIAIIMDGNNRWAKSRKLPLQIGHKKGAENIEKISDACIKIGIKYLTIYAFSSENWDRPKEEVSYLMKLLDEYLEKEIESLMKKNVRIVISGDLTRLSDKTKERIATIENKTKNNNALTLNVAFSYGGRQEIVDAVKKIALAVNEKKISVDDVTQELIAQNLYQPSIPDPDLLIRTAGDFRISNFLLWQSAYTELYFTEIFWPDFSKKDLLNAIINFNKRERRYGKRS